MNDQLNSLQQSQQAKRENIAKWRASQLHEETLPSGLSVTLHDIDMTDLLLSGEMPPIILEMAEQAAANGNQSIDLMKIGLEFMKRDGPAFKKMLDTIVTLCLVDPKIADVADDDHITLSELNNADKMFIFEWSNREVEKLRPFREGEAEPVAVIQPGDSLRIETEPVHASGNGNSPVVS